MEFNFLTNIEKSEIILTGKASYDYSAAKVLNIAYGIDDNFVMPMGVAIISLLENNPQEKICIHVITEFLSEASVRSLQEICDSYAVVIAIHYINSEVFDKLPTTKHFTKATYNRFLLTKILKNKVQRVIYIDADILCLGSLAELKELALGNNIVAVVQDIGAVAERQIKKLGLKQPRYFNAGFLLIDVAAWEENNISEKALQYSFDNLGKLNWLDQDALNYVLQDRAVFIADKYDYIFDFGLPANSQITALPQGTVLVHYAGRYKPWHSWCMHPLQQDFLLYLSKSPWRGMQLYQPKSYKDMKKMGKSYFLNGQYLKGLLWYLKYSYKKILAKL